MTRAGIAAAGATGVVVALAAEARSLAPRLPSGRIAHLASGQMLCVGGVGPTRARSAAEALLAAGATALLSWGVAGALDPGLSCGTLLLATEVISPAGNAPRFETAADWRERIAAELAPRVPLAHGALLTCEAPVLRAADKRRWFETTGALAVDMESAAVAAVALAHGRPFVALRAIVDTADDELPAVVSRALVLPATLAWLPLLAAPRAWGSLWTLRRRYRRACGALGAAARGGLPGCR